MLVNVKDSIPREDQKGVIYKIQCECNAVYVGETGRPKKTRIKEHMADLQHGRIEKSPIAEHGLICNKPFKWDSVDTIGSERHYRRRAIREAMEIKLQGANLNRVEGYQLSQVWYGVNQLKPVTPSQLQGQPPSNHH